jgi:hypothetical protein
VPQDTLVGQISKRMLRRGAALGYFMGVGDFNGRGALTGAGDIIALGALMARGAGRSQVAGPSLVQAVAQTAVVSKKTSKLNMKALPPVATHNEI